MSDAQTPATPSSDSSPTPLPALRRDLKIMEGERLADGSKSWLIFDQLRYRYFQIDEDTFALLSLWSVKTVEALAKAGSQKLDREVTAEELENLFRFIIGNSLTSESASKSYKDYYEQAMSSQKSWWQWLLHNYLFFRIPLVRPQAFLLSTYPLMTIFFSRAAIWFFAILGAIGLYFTGRQWEAFVSTFLHFISWEGAAYYIISLVIVKIAHELGHAYMAVRYGCRVPTMGVAFLLLTPLLYTDVTDAWRLKSREKRLMIDSAGIFAELYLAALALFLWAFLPDGALRSVAFIVATTSLIMSLAINLNPFMKFDGYYILSDAVSIPNLQDRSFAFGKWRLREILFGLGEEVPEPMSVRRIWFMTLYAWGVWIYRFFLFLGIALLVYYMFFKVLGVLLFVVEIMWFILLPIFKEMKGWWTMRASIVKSPRTYVTASVFSAFIALAVIPWSGSVHVPAIMTSANQSDVYVGQAGQVEHIYVEAGDRVKKGDAIIDLVSPALEHEKQQTIARIKLLQVRLARLAGDELDRADSQVLREELSSEQRKLAGFNKQIDEMKVRAPADGIVREFAKDLHVGRWINSELKLASIVVPGEIKLRGVLPERALHRVEVGIEGRFFPDDAARPVSNVVLQKVADVGGETIKDRYLASIYGGPVSVEMDENKEMKTTTGQYVVTMKLNDKDVRHLQDMTLRGQVVLNGKKESFMTGAARQVMGVLIRESGV